MREAQGTRAPVQRLADRVSAVFVPVVISLAIATFVVWYVVGRTRHRSFARSRLLSRCSSSRVRARWGSRFRRR